jgi:ABC-type uncharacterized transport system substrate-binding protein
MILELDDDFSDEITLANLAQSYASITDMMKNGDSWHADDVAAWKELLPAIKLVGGWYSSNFEADIKKAKKLK